MPTCRTSLSGPAPEIMHAHRKDTIFRTLYWRETFHVGAVTYRASIVDPDLDDHAPRLRSGKNLFVRGNTNGDADVDISDGVATLDWLFRGFEAPNCIDAADANNDGEVDISDPSYTFSFLFLGGPVFPEPFPQCGLGRSTIGLPCNPPADDEDACWDTLP